MLISNLRRADVGFIRQDPGIEAISGTLVQARNNRSKYPKADLGSMSAESDRKSVANRAYFEEPSRK
jgi:hypothetical protein